ncbi:hypothetical protein TNCV_3287801 [Trichonephila clavipes]|nr:hypothetical protein TNCV_3287801 [Trichonephila clavipes]
MKAAQETHGDRMRLQFRGLATSGLLWNIALLKFVSSPNTFKCHNSIEAGVAVYRVCALSFRDIARHTDRNPTSVMQILDHWVAEGHIERHARSPTLPMTNMRVQTHIVRSALLNHAIILRFISQEMGMFPTIPVSAHTRDRERFWCAERQNWILECHNVAFTNDPRSVYSILTVVYLSGGSNETVRRLLSYDISIGNLQLIVAASGSSFIPTPLAHTDNQGEGHPRGPPLQSIRLLPWPSRSLDLSSIETTRTGLTPLSS